MSDATRIDIGGGHEIAFVSYQGDERAGIDDFHRKPDGTPCQGFVTIKGGAWDRSFTHVPIPSWELVSWDPLTLSPSLLCRSCGDHGFIRDGKWVKA